MKAPLYSQHTAASPGTVFYDGECGFCRASLRRFSAPFKRAGFEFVPYQENTPGTHPFAPEEFEREMKLKRGDGRWFGGADAWLEMCAQVFWLRPLNWIGRLPGIHQCLHWGYRRIAANRHCLGGRCELPHGKAP
jgi:predicted DCC family thiol-disulfide oxidoreductase YuxK